MPGKARKKPIPAKKPVVAGKKPVPAAKKPVPVAKKGMGFPAAAKAVQKQGVPPQAANAIVAAGARKASPAAKAVNPNLAKVAAKKKGTTPSKRQRSGATSKRMKGGK